MYYERGAWKRAKEEFLKVEKILKMKDNPTRCLLRFMHDLEYHAPISWNGCRELTEK